MASLCHTLSTGATARRSVEPYGLFFLDSQWYLAGRDVRRDAPELQSLDVDGSLTMEHPPGDAEWAIRHVLQYGPEAEALDPSPCATSLSPEPLTDLRLADLLSRRRQRHREQLRMRHIDTPAVGPEEGQ